MFTKEGKNSRITDIIDSDEMTEPSFVTPRPLADMFPEQEDLEFDCSKAVNFVLDDELHDLSDKDQNEKKGCKTESNDTFSVEQIQLDFEFNRTEVQYFSRSNVEWAHMMIGQLKGYQKAILAANCPQIDLWL